MDDLLLDGIDDFYRLLNVMRNASADEIRKAFKKRALQLHPDKNRGRIQYSNDMMTRLNMAKDTLLDPNKRQCYDDNYNDDYVPSQEEISGFLGGGRRISKTYRKKLEKFTAEFGGLLINDNFSVVSKILEKLKEDFGSMFDDRLPFTSEEDQSPSEPLQVHQDNVFTCASDHVIELTANRMDYRHFITAKQSVIDQLESINAQEIPQSPVYADKLVNTPHLRSITKYERAITRQNAAGRTSNWDKAMMYIDLTMSTMSGIAAIHCFVMAMTYLLEDIMAHENATEARTYAVCKIICELAINVVVSAKRCALPITELHFNKTAFIYMKKAHQLLQEKLRECESKKTFFQKWFPSKKKQPTALITETYVTVYKMMANTMVRLIRVSPFVDLPLTLIGDMIYLDVVGDKFVEKFYHARIGDSEKQNSLSYLYSYYLLECSWKIGNTTKFPHYRENAMDALLEQHGWFSGEVENTMMWEEVLNRDQDGWLNIDAPWLNLDGAVHYDSVDGIEIDIETGKFSVQFTQSPPGKSGLFNKQDMLDILENGIQHSLFRLDPPSNDLQFHPFQQLKFSPASLERAPNFLQTLLHADYLLKMISMGVEVSSHWPHPFRNAKVGFMKLLPEYLRDKIRPVTERRGGNREDSCHRFWIESDEVECEQVYDDDRNTLRFMFGRCQMHVKTQLMKHNADGELVDDSEDEDDVNSSDDDDYEDFVKLRKKRITAETQFANDFTEVYDDVGRYFPVLLRLRELLKLLAVHGILNSHYESLETAKENLRSTLTERFGKMFTELRPKVPYPQNASNNVNKCYRKLLSDQGINESRLASGEEDRAKRLIRQQLREVDTELVSKLTTQLSSQLSVSDCSDFAKAVRNWLEGGFFTNYTRQLVEYVVDRTYPKKFEELDRFRKNATMLGVKLRKRGDDKHDNPTGLSTFTDQCPWVPAAFCRHDLGRVYGGVCLIPQLKEVPKVQINNSRVNKGFVNGGVTSANVRSRYYTDESGVQHRYAV